MRKLCCTVLALASVSAGTYALWCGENMGASPPKISADASVRAPTSAALRLLPAEGGDLLYRIKSIGEMFERVAKERELARPEG